MTLTRKDLAATLLTALTVLVYAATHEGWNVWLLGDSRRWATGAILVLGIFACGLGTPGEDRASGILATLGVLAGVFATVALVTASLTALSLLVVDIVVLWALSTVRHAAHLPGRPVST